MKLLLLEDDEATRTQATRLLTHLSEHPELRAPDVCTLVEDTLAIAALYRSLRTHGEGKTRYEVLRTGMNGRLDSIQAAVLLSKLTVFPEELAARDVER